MAKKKKATPFGGNQQNNNGQKSQADRIEELKQMQKDKIDAALITDERVAAKIEELEQAKDDLEEEYKKNKEVPSSDFVNYFGNKYRLDLPTDLFFDMGDFFPF